MRTRAKRSTRRHISSFAQRCKKCSSDRHRHLSILQEMPVPQMFSRFTRSMIDVQSRLSRLMGVVQKSPARTLSRKIWQRKYFHGHSANVSSALAKTDFLDESRAAIRIPLFRRDDQFRFATRAISVRDERSMHACVRRSQPHQRRRRPVTGRLQMPSLDLSRALTAFGSALPPEDFIT